MHSIFEDVEKELETGGPERAIDQLVQGLRGQKDYHGLFYALLLRKRLELGLPPVAAGTADQIPEPLQEPYEEAIRDAARTAGQLYLDQGDIPNAWPFFRMINEPAKVAEAIEKTDPPEEGDACAQLVDIALHQGVHPKKGFDLVVRRYGICSAITTLGQQMGMPADAREHCIRQLVRSLYDELRERLSVDIERREGNRPANASVHDLIAGREWLFEDEFYHVDVSHLSSIVRFSLQLPVCEELMLAMELCEYGLKLSPKFRYHGDPPFDDQYRDESIYLRAVAGQEVEEGIAHFRSKVENSNPEEIGTLPAEVLVNLLARLGRHREAAEAFANYLAEADPRQLNCPTLQELCQKAGDYRPLLEVSRRKGDLVNFAAGLLQSALK